MKTMTPIYSLQSIETGLRRKGKEWRNKLITTTCKLRRKVEQSGSLTIVTALSMYA